MRKDDVSILIVGDSNGFVDAMKKAKESLWNFTKLAETSGDRVGKAMDKGLTGIAKSVGGIDKSFASVGVSIQSIDKHIGSLTVTATQAVTPLKNIAIEMREVAAAARDMNNGLRGSTTLLNNVGNAIASFGTKTQTGMNATVTAANNGTTALNNLTSSIMMAKAAAQGGINVKANVNTKQGGGGRTNGQISTGATHPADRGIALDAQTVGFGMMMLGGVLVEPILNATKVTGIFEDAVQKLYAHAGETAPLSMMRKGILDISAALGQMPDKLAEALYPIESAGYHGAEGLKVLAASAKFATATETDMQDATNLVTKTLNAYNLEADRSEELTDGYTKAIKNAMVTGREFTPALTNVLAMGHSAGLSVDELSTALGVMTRQTKNASTSSTYLKNLLSSIIHPTDATRKAAEALGLGWMAAGDGAAHVKKVGFEKTLQEIAKATNSNSKAFGELFPDMRRVQAIQILLSDGGKQFSESLKDNKKHIGATDEAIKEMQKSLGQLWRNIEAKAGVAGINLVEGMEKPIKRIGKAIGDSLDWFNSLSKQTQGLIGEFATLNATLLMVGGTFLVLFGYISRFIMMMTAMTATIRAVGVASWTTSQLGMVAFASGGGWAVAIMAAIALVGGLAAAWYLVRDAQQKAAEDYSNAVSATEVMGKRHALIAKVSELRSRAGDIDSDLASNQFNEGSDVQGVVGTALNALHIPNLFHGKKDLLGFEDQKDVEKRRERDALLAQADALEKQIKGMPLDTPWRKRKLKSPDPDNPAPPFPEKDKGKGGPPNEPFIMDVSGIEAARAAQMSYRERIEAITLAFEKQRIALLEARKPIDEYAMSTALLRRELQLANSAIHETQSTIAPLERKVASDRDDMNAKGGSLQSMAQRLRAAGGAPSKEDARLYNQLRNSYNLAKSLYTEDNAALTKNRQTYQEATHDKIRFLTELANAEEAKLRGDRERFVKGLQLQLAARKITRDQYDEQLRQGLARVGEGGVGYEGMSDALGQSGAVRQGAQTAAHYQMLSLDKKDTQALEERAQAEHEQRVENGVDKITSETILAKEVAHIRQQAFQQEVSDGEASHRVLMESGQETLTQYESFMQGILSRTIEMFGAGSKEAAAVNATLLKIEFDKMTGFIDDAKHSFAEGDISVQDYVRQLMKLRDTLPRVSSQYRSLSREIDLANRKIREDARRTADEIADKFADAFVKGARSARSFGAEVKAAVFDALETIAKEFIKRQISGVLQHAFPGKVVPDTTRQNSGGPEAVFSAATDAFTTAVQTFTEAVGAMASGGIGGVTGGATGGIGGMNLAGTGGGLAAGGITNALGGLGGIFAGPVGGILGGLVGSLAGSALGSIFNHKQKPDYLTRTGSSSYAQIGSGDHTGLVDSGYSGAVATRSLIAQHMAANDRHQNGNVNFHPGAIVIHAASHHDEGKIADAVINRIGQRMALGDASMGSQ